jgi:lipopolysaccharide export system ATP-binding protein
MPLLTINNLEKSYQKKKVVSNLSYEVHAGEVVGLLGPNGAGKTTAFYMTIGLIRPDGGSVFFKGECVTHTSMHKRALAGMGYLAQEPSIFRSFTVEQNLLAILETLHLSRAEKKRRLQEALEELRLTSIAKKKAGTLSGGERRRLEITRALLTRPSLLLLDEPFANIDPIAISEVKTLIHHLAKKGISVLITDHNARELFSIIDRGYLIQEGSVFLAGSVSELCSNEQAKVIYLGEDFRM